MVDIEGDVASDLSVYHRVDDMHGMGSRRWAQLVPRLPYYQGAVWVCSQAQAQAPEAPPATREGAGGGVAPEPAFVAPAGPWKADTVVESTRAALAFSDIGDMFSWGTP